MQKRSDIRGRLTLWRLVFCLLYLERLLSSSQYGLDANKRLSARIQLGSTTNTLDADGDIILVKPVPELTEHTIVATLKSLTGSLMQIPRWYRRLNTGGSRCIDGLVRAEKLSDLREQFKS